MNRICLHFRRWNKWRKINGNSKLHKLLVLLGIVKSPTFGTVWLSEEEATYYEGVIKGISPVEDIMALRASHDPGFKKRLNEGGLI